jgi:hypothetical protein
VGVVSYGHTRDTGPDKRHRRDARRSDGEVSVGVGSAGKDMRRDSRRSTIDLKRDHTNLSSALRVFVLDFYRKQQPPLE